MFRGLVFVIFIVLLLKRKRERIVVYGLSCATSLRSLLDSVTKPSFRYICSSFSRSRTHYRIGKGNMEQSIHENYEGRLDPSNILSIKRQAKHCTI